MTAMLISRLIFLPFFNALLLVCAAGTRLLKGFFFFNLKLKGLNGVIQTAPVRRTLY